MLGILGIVITIVFTIFAYKTAKEYGRNAVSWALLTFGVGIIIQIILPVFIIILIAVIATIGGGSAQQIQDNVPMFTVSELLNF